MGDDVKVARNRALVVFAALFQAAGLVGGKQPDPKANYDAAQAHLDEAERRGIDLKDVFG